MATKKQRAALKRARAAKRNKGLGGITTGFKANQLLAVLKNAGMLIAGLVIGNDASKQVIKFLPESTPQMLRTYLPSIIKLGGGVILSNQKVSGVDLKFLGIGMLSAGLLDGIKQATGKDLQNQGILGTLKGLGLSGSAIQNLNPAIEAQLTNMALADERETRREYASEIIEESYS